MPDDPSVYGSFMNFFLPQSARIPGMPAGPPGLYDMLGGMGFPGAAAANNPGPADEAQQREQQRKQQQQLALAQSGLGLLTPRQTAPPVAPMQNAPQMPPAQLPPATQVTPSPPPGYGAGGMQSPYGGMPGANAYAQRRAMPMPMPNPFGGGGGYGR